jgi:hypothetical protein
VENEKKKGGGKGRFENRINIDTCLFSRRATLFEANHSGAFVLFYFFFYFYFLFGEIKGEKREICCFCLLLHYSGSMVLQEESKGFFLWAGFFFFFFFFFSLSFLIFLSKHKKRMYRGFRRLWCFDV